ncbi:AraC family transcriptional regulator [Streptomyces sp. ALB3]|uniref:AraC family transcriptional regulator n=1 Tax=Streptomyces sp. ALB3 TaxID=3374278 RepID=UPI0037AA0124
MRSCCPRPPTAVAFARAIEWLKLNYARPLRIEDLADHVHLSASSLHHHFRALTAMTPLQYQKWLRLQKPDA